MSALNGNPATAVKIQTAGGFADGDVEITAGEFEITPDVVGHVIGGSEPPAGLSILNGFDDGTFANLRFAEAATTGDDLKTGCAFENLLLIGMRIWQVNEILGLLLVLGFLLHLHRPFLLRHSQFQRV